MSWENSVGPFSKPKGSGGQKSTNYEQSMSGFRVVVEAVDALTFPVDRDCLPSPGATLIQPQRDLSLADSVYCALIDTEPSLAIRMHRP